MHFPIANSSPTGECRSNATGAPITPMVAGPPPKAGSRLSMPSPQSEIARYLRTGAHDILFKAWPGNHVLDCCQRGTADLRRALARETKARTASVAIAVPEMLAELDCEEFARKKVAPMVRGLF